MFQAGNGVGKTAVGAVIVANIIWGKGSDWFDYPLFNKFPYRKRGRIISDPTTVQSILIPELEKWFPKGRYSNSKMGKNYPYMWKSDTGHMFDVMTYEQALKEFESATLGWVLFDEPPPEAIYKATVARMRRGGIIFIGMTPLIGSAWMYDHIATYQDKTGILKRAKNKQRAVVKADVEDNCIEHGIRGILTHKNIQRMLAEYDEDELEARAHGNFIHLSGRVFKKFDKKIHVIEPFLVTKRDYSVWHALDPHPRNPDAALWVAVDKYGTKFIVDEDYRGGRTSALARRIKNINREYRIEEYLIDPSAFNEDQHDDLKNESLGLELYNKYGLDYDPASKSRTRADRRIRDALDYERRGKDLIVVPELYIFSTCPRTIYELEHYQWDEWKGKTKDEKHPKEKPKDKDDHEIENLGRILLREPALTRMPIIGATSNIGVKTNKEMDPYD